MLFNKKQRSAVNAASRRAFQIVSVILVLVAILNRFDFSGISAGWIAAWVTFTAIWLIGAGIAAKRRWLRFRCIALLYWGVAFASGFLRLLLEHFHMVLASEMLGFPQHLLVRLPLNAAILAVSGGAALTKAAIYAGLLYYAWIMIVFYIILWRNEKLLLD